MSSRTLVFLPPQTEKHRDWAGRLAADVAELDVVVTEDDDTALEVLRDADAAFGTLTVERLQAAPGLRWLQAPLAAPPAGYYFPELTEHPVVVTNLRGVYTEHVATHSTALILALARGLHRHLPNQFWGIWDQDRSPSSVIHLPEATMLLVGVGAVGSLIAEQCAAFGVRTIGIDAKLKTHPDMEVHPPTALDDLLPAADIVCLTVPHTPATEGMMDRRRFRRMKPAAVFVNIGRGGTVRLLDLVEALHGGELAGAALDVFEQEPLPPGHPLWTAPNLLMTPHVAVAGPYVEERQYDVVRENARRFLAGEELLNLVDKAAWY